jgi:eukaryotic-like serine/threonine-protein kinase
MKGRTQHEVHLVPIDPELVQSVFLSAAEYDDPVERAATLDRECSTDTELRERVLALLRAHDGFNEFVNQPLVSPLNQVVATSGESWLDPSDLTSCVFPEDRESAEELSSSDGDPAGTEADRTMFVRLPPDGPACRERPVPIIGGYEILCELGRGGMGVVYRARQVRLNRACVLKMILGGGHAGVEATARFLAEAEAVARLQHPNIVQIHHIGEADGLPFFELEYVPGGSLDRRLHGTPWPVRRASDLIEALARGVAEAHRQGIVHRDLKPGNVLLAIDGTPKLTDFGLAKSLAADSGLTRTDSIMGSPGYMAPEQAEGKTKRVGPLADVYALGAILYELLTGGPPFRGTTALDILEQVKNTEPVPPSRLVPGLPRDIETIALKCLQKEPEKRYDSAAAVAGDLRRFLDGEAIVARPVPFWEQGWRWCRRNPVPAALSAAIVVVSALGLAGILWQWSEAARARDLASTRAIAEASAREKAQKSRAEVETTLVDMYTTSGIQAGDQGEHARAALWFANAARRAEADPDRRQSNLIRAQTWGRRAFRPLNAVVADGAWPVDLVFHPGGRYLITADLVNQNEWITDLSLWDLESEQPHPFPGGHARVPAAAWSPDGEALAVGLNHGDVLVAGFPGGDGPTRIPFPPNIRRLTYSPDGRFLAIAGEKSARVWDVRSHTFATPVLVHPEVVTSLAFHPEGRCLATGCLDQQARLFAVPSDAGGPLWPPVPHRQQGGTAWYREFGSPPRFVNGGRELITCDGDKLMWRAADTGAEIRTQQYSEWKRGLASIVLSPDGQYFARLGVMHPPYAQLVETATGRLVGPALEHQNTIMGADFSPDGRMLATCATDNTVRLWSVPGGKPLARPLELHRTVHLVAFSPGGRALATQDSGLVRLWALPEEGVPTARVPLDGKSSLAALSPDGALVIPAGMNFQGESTLRSTRPHYVATGQPAGPPLPAVGHVAGAVFSSDGRSIALLGGPDATATEARELAVWDWAAGRQQWRSALPSEPRSVAYRPDGRRLVALCGGGELIVFEAESGHELWRWHAHDIEPAHHWVNNGKVGFSPDGRSLLTWGMGNDLRVWEAESGRPRYPYVKHRDKCHDVQFSPDGQLVAVASYDGSVRVRDFATGAVVTELPDHPDVVYTAGFSPDGRLLVTACRDRSVRVWDWRAVRLVCPPFEHARDAVAATFTPDGRWVLSASVDGAARAWDWRTGKPVTPPLTIGGEPLSVAVTPDGMHAVVGGGLAALAVLDLSELAPSDVDPGALCRWAELLSGQRLYEGGGTVNLSAAEWLDRWRSFRQQSPATAYAEPNVDSAPPRSTGRDIQAH